MSESPRRGRELQSAGAVLLVRPANFTCNPQTAASNAFQQTADGGGGPGEFDAAVLREFEGVVDLLRCAGVRVTVAQDTASPVKPDAVFPNNWVSFHADGTVVLYPMLAANRRWERREDLIQQVAREGSHRIARCVDLSHWESEARYLEGTGSLVLDRTHGIAYACLSPRTHPDVLEEFARLLHYTVLTFDARDPAGRAIYHTNVMMAVGTSFAVVCSAAIDQPAQRAAVLASLHASGHEVIAIDPPQMLEFAGNLLELESATGPVIALSTRAWRSLEPVQRRALERHGRIAAADITHIERFGGGGVRCMIAEVHLPSSL